MDATYAEIGTEVVIGFYYEYQIEPDYIFPTQKYYGRRTVITDRVGDRCLVQIDNGEYRWPIQDMILASDIDLLSPEQQARIK